MSVPFRCDCVGVVVPLCAFLTVSNRVPWSCFYDKMDFSNYSILFEGNNLLRTADFLTSFSTFTALLTGLVGFDGLNRGVLFLELTPSFVD